MPTSAAVPAMGGPLSGIQSGYGSGAVATGITDLVSPESASNELKSTHSQPVKIIIEFFTGLLA